MPKHAARQNELNSGVFSHTACNVEFTLMVAGPGNNQTGASRGKVVAAAQRLREFGLFQWESQSRDVVEQISLECRCRRRALSLNQNSCASLLEQPIEELQPTFSPARLDTVVALQSMSLFCVP